MSSIKMQAENKERPAADCGKSVLKIKTPKACIDCPCHFAGESGMVVCGVNKKELLTDDIETFKPNWCPMKDETMDCGGGWIPCKDRLPEVEQDVLLSFRSLDIRVGYRANTDGFFYVYGEDYIAFENTLAWKPLPEVCHG